ncbi:hypothetical protein AC482_05755 [miscellaneous Crenarchaeota group-15 archaeon DG-45]|uniref:BPL/LPL catalytic domain-containing protein n=1 Tax=miscellaneous Crenarchaeota group-15 archaeon DG-45 TaxID=1685127 RepID=A0A0M0BN33_9ARCH|nr:MAG: hypothetical protein AC482_05755 [miscellaneous Crenarchaeota group-15 archaeon DG-45]
MKELSLDEIRARLRTARLGHVIHLMEEASSTNEVAKGLAHAGAEEGCVVVAERQRQGRGRLGRRWHSPAGGLWFSVILRPEMDAREAPRLTLTAAVAIANAIRGALGLQAEVKWPNDILVRGRKVCGILTETVLKGGELCFVVLGIGINANIDKGELPGDVGESAATLREASGEEVDRNTLLCRCLEQLEAHYAMLGEGGINSILEEWRRLAPLLGEEVEVRGLDLRVRGRALDVDEDGALVLELDDGARYRVISGDVSLRSRRDLGGTTRGRVDEAVG